MPVGDSYKISYYNGHKYNSIRQLHGGSVNLLNIMFLT